MDFFEVYKDGFRGKPDFTSFFNYMFKIDEYVISFECPNNTLESYLYEDDIDLGNFDISSSNEEHETVINLASVNFSFFRVFFNPIAPVNKQGDLFIKIKIKSIDGSVKTNDQLSSYLEKEYFEYYHDPNPSSDSTRGEHTESMRDFIERANRQWGEFPESEEMILEKEKYLIDSFYYSYPPIKCENVKIGKYTFSKYLEGSLKYKGEFSRVYNLIIKDGFCLSIEFWYATQYGYPQKKFLKWIERADETFEKEVLERLEMSNCIDSKLERKVDIITRNIN
ncbi:DNAase [Vibrio harveyi]|uniref:DNAase n=1 Tax=Vibrio harveyi TaxID=669 RepID=UPI000D78A7A4|nr:DNAase [Vibrio harveyi]EKO3861528.1 DNAase [Vibrio harveyi]MCQ9081643.1 DNAase [Vibrio harveyi]GBK98530.1 Mg-dependent DNase [Vibrio harveyi]HDM8062356.1 DNAase [Vibrio harveyi]